MRIAPYRPMLTAAMLLLSACVAAEGSGRYRLPSNVPQFLGYGNGPGYHAPMVLGVFGGPAPPRIRRVLHPPMSPPHHVHGFGQPVTLIHTAPAEAYPPVMHHAPTPVHTPTPAPARTPGYDPRPRPRKPGTTPRNPPSGREPRSPSNSPAAETLPPPRP